MEFSEKDIKEAKKLMGLDCPEIEEAYNEALEDESEFDERKVNCLNKAEGIIQVYNNIVSGRDPVKRIFDLEDDEKVKGQWLEEANTLFIPIYDTVFNITGSLQVRYLMDCDSYGFRIDDIKISQLIATGQLEPCLCYKNDEEDSLFYFECNEVEINKILNEYDNLIHKQCIDNIVMSKTDFDTKVSEIRGVAIDFSKKLQEVKPKLEFRTLVYVFSNPDTNSISALFKIILWPENPCPIAAKSNDLDENPERKKLIRSIHEYFHYTYVDKYLSENSIVKSLVSNGDGEFLSIIFRREEDKMLSRIEACIYDEREYVVYDTVRKDFGGTDEYYIWNKTMRYEIALLGSELANCYKDILSFKLTFNTVLDEDENIRRDVLTMIYIREIEIEKSSEDLETDILEMMITIINSNPKKYKVLNSSRSYGGDEKSKFKYHFSFSERDKTNFIKLSESLNKRIVYEYVVK